MEYAELKTVTDPNILSFNIQENINCETTQQFTVANGNSVMHYSSNFNKKSQHLPVPRSESALSISTPSAVFQPRAPPVETRSNVAKP